MRKVSFILALMLIISCLPQLGISVQAAENFIYVAPDGNDSAAGTIDAPLKTLNAARLKAQQLKSSGAVTVYFRKGEYPITSTVNFSSEDSGTANAPIAYKAYNKEEVIFTGCETFPASVITPVTENDTDAYGNKILDRVISDMAKSKLVKIDLSGFSGALTEAGDRGWSMGGAQPTEVFVNNEIINEARWPNDEDLKAMFRTQNGTSGKTFVYPDAEDRTKMWNAEAVVADGLYATGWYSSYWYCHSYKIGSIDTTAKTATILRTNPYSSFQSGRPAYFHNLLEEIDMPGEGFIDKARKIAYYYPSTDITLNTKVRVSNLRTTMVSISGASYINFDGLNFMYTISTPVNVGGSSYITFNDCVIAHTSSQGIVLKGSNLKLINSHVFDTAYGGLTTNGGSRSNLTPANNEIVNNIFHHNDRLNHCYQASIQVDYNSVGIKIYNNLIYNTHHEAIAMAYQTNDIDISYNEIHHAVKESGDMGAIYWGRDPSVLGINISNNFFHHNGNPYNDGFNQSIFGDDGNIGAYIYGNVFYQGTLTAENGGTTGQSFPVKTNGGQYYNVQNNIFIDSPTAVNFQEWVGSGFSSPYQSRYIVYNYDIDLTDSSVGISNGQWSKVKNYCDNETWINHYAGTHWENFFNDFSIERYNTLRNLASAGDRTGVINYLKTFVPSKTNIFKNNAAIKISNRNYVNGMGNAQMGDNYFDTDELTKKGQPLFEDYDNMDFSITDAGLTEIRKYVPEFQDIEFEKMGIHGNVDGSAPVVTNASIAPENGLYKVSYKFTDADGDREGATKFVWYASDKADGKYERIYGFGDSEAEFVDETYGGKYVKVEITPFDSRTRYGKTVTTEPVLIQVDASNVDRSDLKNAIDSAKRTLNSATVGGSSGQYPLSAYNTLKAAIETAESYYNAEVLYNYQVKSQTVILNNAVSTFKTKKIVPTEYITLNGMLKNPSGWNVISGSAPTFSNGSMTLAPNSVVAYNAEQFRNTVFRFKVKYNRQDNIDVNVQYTMGSVYFRQNDPNNIIWSGSNTGYLFWIKNTQLEAQIWEPANTITEFRNDSIVELDKEYVFEVGVYDIGDEAVKWVLSVNGELIHEEVYSKEKFENLYGKSGYFCIGAGLPSVTVSPLESYYIRFNPNGGLGGPSEVSADFSENAVIPTSAPTRTGYILEGWSETPDGKAAYRCGDKIKLTGDMTLYAIWKKLPVVSVESWNGAEAVITSDTETGCVVVFASYKDGVLYDVKAKQTTLTPDGTTVSSNGLKTDGATVKILVINSFADLLPLCESYQ